MKLKRDIFKFSKENFTSFERNQLLQNVNLEYFTDIEKKTWGDKLY